MPILTAPVVTPDGPLVRILLGPSRSQVHSLRLAGRPLPQPVELTALVDTGAEVSAVDPGVITGLGLPLKAAGLANVPATGGPTETWARPASLSILHPSNQPILNLVISALDLFEVPLTGLGYEALIGRDVLSRCVLIYDGPAAVFTLAY
jgi:hypothetical protein